MKNHNAKGQKTRMPSELWTLIMQQLKAKKKNGKEQSHRHTFEEKKIVINCIYAHLALYSYTAVYTSLHLPSIWIARISVWWICKIFLCGTWWSKWNNMCICIHNLLFFPQHPFFSPFKLLLNWMFPVGMQVAWQHQMQKNILFS